MENAVVKSRTYEEYRDEYNRIDGTANWAKGDLLNDMLARHAEYGNSYMERLSEDADTPVSTLYAYAQVARTYPENSRRLEIPWSVYHVLVNDPEATELIAAWPDSKGWVDGTVRDAKELARFRKIAALTEKAAPSDAPQDGAGEEEQDTGEDTREGGEEEAPAFTVLAKNTHLAQAMKNAALFAGTDKANPGLTGIHLHAENGVLAVQATDRASAIRQEIPCEGTADIFVNTWDADKVTQAMKVVEGFTVAGKTVTFTGRENPVDGSYITVGVPWRNPEKTAAPLIPGVMSRNAGGKPYRISAELLARLAKAARNAGEEIIIMRFSGPGKAVIAEAGNLRMAVQPRRDLEEGKDDAGDAGTSAMPSGTGSPAGKVT